MMDPTEGWSVSRILASPRVTYENTLRFFGSEGAGIVLAVNNARNYFASVSNAEMLLKRNRTASHER